MGAEPSRSSSKIHALFDALPAITKLNINLLVQTILANEALKAQVAVNRFDWQNLTNWFRGTSLTGLVSLPCYSEPLDIFGKGLAQLAREIATAYLKTMSRDFTLFIDRSVNKDDRLRFSRFGLFHTVEISAKVLSLAIGLAYDKNVLTFPDLPDSYLIPDASLEIASEYYRRVQERIGQAIAPGSLALADTSYPRNLSPGLKILHPINTNDLLAELAPLVVEYIHLRKNAYAHTSNLGLEGLLLVVGDTDSPHRFHSAMGHDYMDGYFLTPGVTLLGATSPMSQFSVLPIYRMALISQQLRGNSVASDCSHEYLPFVFYGIITPIDIESGMFSPSLAGQLRYPGNIDTRDELMNLLPFIEKLSPSLLPMQSTA